MKKNESELCKECFCRAQQMRWTHCARCGARSCAGACQKLEQFSAVYSLYTYTGCFSDILVLAKDKNDAIAQRLFFNLFFVPVRLFLLEIFNKKDYSHVLFSPCKRERVLHAAWHPNLFFARTLESILTDPRLQATCPQPVFPLVTRKSQRQAWVPSHLRQKISVKTNVFEKNGFFLDTSGKTRRRILLVDDVLTSGATAQGCFNLLGDGCPVDLFTLFRSPQKNAY